MRVVLRTHGGLGNQIFQVLYARLYAQKHSASLREVHDLRYKHRFARSSKLGKCTERINIAERLLSALRLPKVLNRLGFGANEKISLFGTIYLDGYFQEAHHYTSFNQAMVAEQLSRIRNELQISTENKRGELVHLRLGDFFSSNDAARQHAIERLKHMRPGSTIITNQEKLMKESELQSILINIDCQMESTEGFSPEEIIQFMTQFRKINANDSTLTFWASVLGGCSVKFTNPKLIETNLFFKTCLQP